MANFKFIDSDGMEHVVEGIMLVGEEDSSGKPAGNVVTDGLAADQSRVVAGTYNTTTIYAVQILLVGTGTLTLTPLSGAVDVVITSAEITAMGAGTIIYGPWTEVVGGTAVSLLIYHE